MTPKEEFNDAVWWTLQEIELARLFSEAEKLVDEKRSDVIDFEIKDKSNAPPMDNQRRAVEFLEKREAVAIMNRKYPMKLPQIGAELYNLKPIGYDLRILQLKFEELYKSYGDSAEIQRRALMETFFDEPEQENIYKISVKDREIWINNYLIGKPHAIGSNFEFFEYIRLQKPNTKINREVLPNFGGSLSLKEQVKSKSFIKIVNELGFKSEILKAFFYNRGKDTITYRGDQITPEDLEKTGVKKSLFLKELELAHARNSPE